MLVIDDLPYLFSLFFSSLFPTGLPDQFALVLTLRMDSSSPSSTWHILRIDDIQRNVQFAVEINAITQDVTLYVLNARRRLSTVNFHDNKQYLTKVGKATISY